MRVTASSSLLKYSKYSKIIGHCSGSISVLIFNVIHAVREREDVKFAFADIHYQIGKQLPFTDHVGFLFRRSRRLFSVTFSSGLRSLESRPLVSASELSLCFACRNPHEAPAPPPRRPVLLFSSEISRSRIRLRPAHVCLFHSVRCVLKNEGSSIWARSLLFNSPIRDLSLCNIVNIVIICFIIFYGPTVCCGSSHGPQRIN